MDDAFPTWSPDGSRLAWSRGSGSDREIWVAAATEGGPDDHDLTSGADDRFPAWSSSGLLAFQRRAGSGWEIWVLEPDVSGPVVRIALGDGGGATPAWSPDGRRIAFVREAGGANRIFTASANGVSDLREVTEDVDCDCEFPSWSPDGREIAFVGPRGDIRPLLVVSADGGPARRLTTNGLVPSWWD